MAVGTDQCQRSRTLPAKLHSLRIIEACMSNSAYNLAPMAFWSLVAQASSLCAFIFSEDSQARSLCHCRSAPALLQLNPSSIGSVSDR